jgi:hypothetical protein
MDQPSSDDISLEKADHVNSDGNMVGEESMMSVKYKIEDYYHYNCTEIDCDRTCLSFYN